MIVSYIWPGTNVSPFESSQFERNKAVNSMRRRAGMLSWVSGLFRTRRNVELRRRRTMPVPFSAWVDVLENRALLSGTPTIPFTLNAPTSLANQGIYVAMYGSIASPVTNSDHLNVQYYIEWDTSGNAQQVPTAANSFVEVEKLGFTPNAQQSGISTVTIQIPDIPNGNSSLSINSNQYQLNGARLVFGIGHQPYLPISSSGTVAAPAPSSLNDPNTAQNYDFVEFTLDQAGMHINTSTVDQFGFPITVSATPVTNIASASNGVSLPFSTSGSINVASTAGFPSQGQIQVMVAGQIQTISYTGTTGTAFTGCTGGSGTLSTGDDVWSVSTYITPSGVGIQMDRQGVFDGFGSFVGSSSPFYSSLVDGNTQSAGSIYLPAPASGYLSAHSGNAAITVQVYNVSPNDPLLKVNFGSTQVTPTSQTYDPTSKLTTLTVTPPSLPNTNATVDVTVTSTGGTSTSYPNIDYYKFGNGGTPTVTGLSASTGPLMGGNMVLISGSNFQDPNIAGGVCTVTFNGHAAAFTVLSTTTIMAYAPSVNSAQSGPVSVTIGNVPASGTATYTYINQLPTVNLLSPNNGAVGQTITITGINYVAKHTTVKFGSLTGTSVTVLSPTSLTVQVPPGGSGTVDVTVITSIGTSPISNDDRFNFPTAPAYSPTNSLRLVNPSDILAIESNPPVSLYAKCEPGGSLLNQPYYYEVTATSNSGESLPSNVQNATAGGITGFNSIAVVWTPFLNATGYNIYRSTSLAGPFQFLAHYNSGQSSKFLDDGSASPTSQQPPSNMYTYDPLASYFDAELVKFFNHYAPTSAGGDGKTFTLTYGGVTFTGTTKTDGAGRTYLDISGSGSSFKVYQPLFNTNTNNSSYPPPPSGLPVDTESPGQMVFSGDGVFALNTGTNSGEVENIIVAAFNRGIATDFSISPTDWGTSSSKFYRAKSTANFYAAYMHQPTVSISDDRPTGGVPLAYGFSYDDQGGSGNGYGSYFSTPAVQPTANTPVPNGDFAITVNFGSWAPATKVQLVSPPTFDLHERPLDFKVQLTDDNGAAVFQGGKQITLQITGPHGQTTTYTLITNPDGTATGKSTSTGQPVEIVRPGTFALSFTAPGFTTQKEKLRVDSRSIQLKRWLLDAHPSTWHDQENFCQSASGAHSHTTTPGNSHRH